MIKINEIQLTTVQNPAFRQFFLEFCEERVHYLIEFPCLSNSAKWSSYVIVDC